MRNEPSKRWQTWIRRRRKRWIVLGILAGVYFGVQVVDLVFERFLLDSALFQSGPLKMTARHFTQPDENLFTWSNFNKFLDNVTRHKPGILGQKWLYVALIALYLGLAILVFLRLTEPDERDPEEPGEGGVP